MATNLRLTAPVIMLICLQLISTGRVCATLKPEGKLLRWSETTLIASKPLGNLKTIQFKPPPPNQDKKSPKKTEAGGGR